jgi:Spy/CpxP family protein refolding chaperone
MAYLLTIAATALCAICLGTTSACAQKFTMDDNQFNQWLYQGNGQAADRDSEIVLMVDSMDRACHLSSEQKDKLRLAGLGDYSRFEQKVNDLRAEVVGKSYDQNKINDIYQKFQPLTRQYQAGMLGPDSIFSKVVHRTLTPEQREEYEAAEADRRKARHAAKVRLFVALLEQSCPLKASQRDALVDLLLKDTQPALRNSEYDWYVVIVQAARLPESKLKPILDRPQLTYFKKITANGRGMEGMLRQQGILPRK